MQFGDSGQNDDGVLGYDQATNKMYILTNHSTTKKLVVDSSGNVGIGTASPEHKLHVDGDIRATGDVIANRLVISSSVSHITSSFSSGSTIFGDSSADTHQFTGSLLQSEIVLLWKEQLILW